VSKEENKTLARRFYEEVWNLGNSEFAYEVFADEYVRHDLRPTQALPGPAGQKKIADDFRARRVRKLRRAGLQGEPAGLRPRRHARRWTQFVAIHTQARPNVSQQAEDEVAGQRRSPTVRGAGNMERT
jgi:hypothetical protein